MIPTPDLSHLKKTDYDNVYEPAEDTFLLLDALEEDAEELKAMQPRLCLEVGSGSGCVSSFMGSILGAATSLYLTTDINSFASRCTSRTGTQNKIPIDSVTTSLVSSLLPRIQRAVDVLIFNPPYVPTYTSEAQEAQDGRDIRGAWAGGINGMQVTDMLLEHVEDLLSSNGRFYLVAVKENNISELQQRMRQQYDLESKIVLQRKAGREHLHVIRFSRS
ncbi:S-adenosyl-L-methionine-dependent methyltransferase [Cristinia sonorae]|uniref:S-adenosyl-L-methionine-dependent methyltransferase n=1 Tax=Cristinia sonorae TaxID=1940300 RepID=A0A8K0XL62_9AGAR|nr:S-adenosyl-L-methionine-dependent methyltransferase [Cristinia sonorae]